MGEAFFDSGRGLIALSSLGTAVAQQYIVNVGTCRTIIRNAAAGHSGPPGAAAFHLAGDIRLATRYRYHGFVVAGSGGGHRQSCLCLVHFASGALAQSEFMKVPASLASGR